MVLFGRFVSSILLKNMNIKFLELINNRRRRLSEWIEECVRGLETDISTTRQAGNTPLEGGVVGVVQGSGG